MAKITDEMMGHAADNDGIEEYDNPLPDWWVGLFLITIVYGIGYAVDYHFIRPTSQIQMYEEEMQLAAMQWPESDTPKELSYDAETLAAGAEIFTQQCVACHNEGGKGGGIGPSLIDAEWIHGFDADSVRNTITNGVAAKGMPAWGAILGPDKVAKVSAYVMKLPREEPVMAAAGEGDATEAGGDEAAAGAPIDVDLGAMSDEERQTFLMELGEKVYLTGDGGIACTTCHQANGEGVPGAFPPLVGQKELMGDCVNHAGIVINGLNGEMVVNGQTYNGVMTAQGEMLDDIRIAAVISYARNSWGNDYGYCSPEDVAKARAAE